MFVFRTGRGRRHDRAPAPHVTDELDFKDRMCEIAVVSSRSARVVFITFHFSSFLFFVFPLPRAFRKLISQYITRAECPRPGVRTETGCKNAGMIRIRPAKPPRPKVTRTIVYRRVPRPTTGYGPALTPLCGFLSARRRWRNKNHYSTTAIPSTTSCRTAVNTRPCPRLAINPFLFFFLWRR